VTVVGMGVFGWRLGQNPIQHSLPDPFGDGVPEARGHPKGVHPTREEEEHPHEEGGEPESGARNDHTRFYPTGGRRCPRR